MDAMSEIERRTRHFSVAHEMLRERVRKLEDEIEAAKRRLLPGIKSAVQQAAEKKAALRAEVERHPDLFERPRTVVLHGIKVGMQKGKGGVEWDDAGSVVGRIERLMPDQAEGLVTVTKRPNKSGLQQLTATDLKRIGCRLVNTGDEPVIKPTDGDVEKVVEALLKGAEEEG